MSSLINTIKVLFTKRPFVTNAVTYGTLCVAAELTQQVIRKKILAEPHEPFDKPLLARYAILGTIILPPMSYTWYKWLDTKFKGTSKHVTIRKLLLDQLVMGPASLTVFFVGMALLEFSPEPFREFREKFIRTYEESILFWLPAQTINFAYIPPQYRILYIGIITYIWVNILCLIKRQKN